MRPASIQLRCWLLAILAIAVPSFGLAQTDGSPAPSTQTAPGPGRKLPEHSKPRTYDFTGLQERAFNFSERIREPARELFTVLAMLALIWSGYHAQFRGMEEFAGVLLRMVITAALITEYRDMMGVLLESRDALSASISTTGGNICSALGGMVQGTMATISIMSVTGIATGVAIAIVVVLILILYTAQLLLQAVLIGFGPLALATLAFQHSRGIFTMWLKSLIAVLLIPVGWKMAGTFVYDICGWSGTYSEIATDLLTALFGICSLGAAFIGMPFVTVFIVNSAGGAVATAGGSFLAAASTLFAGGSRLSSGGGAAGSIAGGSTTITTAVSGTSAPAVSSISTSVPALSPGAGARETSAYEQRIATAYSRHQEWASKIQPSAENR